MKKTMIFAAFAALISLASCQKEDVIDNNATDNQASPVFTASIAGATKTTIDVTNGKVAWEMTDEITITDASSASAVYTIESIDETTGRATFVIKDGETALGAGPYTATYGTAPATEQTYSATAGKLYMTAETSTNSFTFDVQCGLMKLNLTKTGESVKSIAVSSSTATYTLTCTEAQSIASAKDFYIALPAGSYTKIVITDSEDKVCTLNSTSGLAIEANHIKPVTFDGSKLNFASAVPADVLAGEFSVSATKKVQFTKGNLYYDGSALNFEASQYAFNSSYESSHVSHFTWSSAVADAVSTSSSGDNLFCDENHKVAVNGSEAIYYALSTEEWQYLFNNHSKQWVTVNGVNGYVIAPDGFTGTLAASYADDAALAADNLVFLPAAGFRNGSNVIPGIFGGYYWSSTAYNEGRAYSVHFDSSVVSPDGNEDRRAGYSVRLITESAGGYAPTVAVTGVTLTKDETTIVAGAKETIVVTVAPANATNKQVIWSSSNPSVATVDANGDVTGVAEGSAVISATTTDGNFTAVCQVTVTSTVAVTGVTLTKDETTIVAGAKETIVATVAPANATNKQVIWSSSNPSVATVDANGDVTGVAEGSAVISATTTDGNFTAVCQVTVTPKPLPADVLAGEFSVSATKKVQFTKGNLYYDGSALNFEASQYAFNSSYESSHVSHFTWSSAVADAVSTSSSGDNLFCDENHKVAVNGSEAIYYALSTEEWQYLFNNHSKQWATVNGVNGYVIAPDGFTGTLAASYADDAALAADNLVFLPAAGFRNGSNVIPGSFGGYYWSSTAYNEDEGRAYSVYFSSSVVYPGSNEDRRAGYSVRLITDVK